MDTLFVSTHGVGFDGLLNYYKSEQVIDQELTNTFIDYLRLPGNLAKPYIVGGSEKLSAQLGKDLIHGMTATSPGFYGPQGRELRARIAMPDLTDRVASFSNDGRRVINFEMETAALYGLGAIMGHQMLTICTVLANREAKTYSSNPKKAIDAMISLVLERLTA